MAIHKTIRLENMSKHKTIMVSEYSKTPNEHG